MHTIRPQINIGTNVCNMPVWQKVQSRHSHTAVQSHSNYAITRCVCVFIESVFLFFTIFIFTSFCLWSVSPITKFHICMPEKCSCLQKQNVSIYSLLSFHFIVAVECCLESQLDLWCLIETHVCLSRFGMQREWQSKSKINSGWILLIYNMCICFVNCWQTRFPMLWIKF